MKINLIFGNMFTALLTVLFIGLKLTHYIAWSWWWVLSPIWISWVSAILIFATLFLFYVYVREW